MEAILMKRQCKCGRRRIVKRPTFGTGTKPVCGYCKTYGLKESIRLKEDLEQQILKGGNQDDTKNM